MQNRADSNENIPVNPLTLPEVQEALLAGQPVPEKWRRKVTDLSPLAEMTALKYLHLRGTAVTDLSPLTGLTGLEHLDIGGTKVTDLSPLAGLAELKHLYLGGTRVRDLSPLAVNKELSSLHAEYAWVSDLSPLAELETLRSLHLAGLFVSNLSPLAGLRSLTRLQLSRTWASNVSPLKDLTALEELDLTGRYISDVWPLAGLAALKRLNLRGTRVSDLSPLAGLTTLNNLDVTNTLVTDLSPLTDLTELHYLNLKRTRVTDITPLAHLRDLRIKWDGPPEPNVHEAAASILATASIRAEAGVVTAKERAMQNRVKLVFDTPRHLQRALATEMPGLDRRVVSRRRGFMAVQRPAGMSEDQFADMIERLVKRTGARPTVDFQFRLEDRPGFSPTHTIPVADAEPGGTLADVLAMIGVADNRSRGAGVSIAVVDTGVNGRRAEFPEQKRSGQWAPDGENAWADEDGHGTMCATIAAASPFSGGEFRGVAPDAGLIACRTWFYGSELSEIYDMLADRAEAGEVIVASNSYGTGVGYETPEPEHYALFKEAFDRAINAGVHVVFSAGNYHDLAGGTPDSSKPNSIWLEKGQANLLTVATCDLEETMWYYSSRGPGQFFGQPGAGRKPDVTAPTPRNGVILFGDETVIMPDGWGTSGAAPQVAGLLALLLSIRSDLPRDEVFDIVRQSARKVGAPDHFAHESQGHGMIDCGAAFILLDRRHPPKV